MNLALRVLVAEITHNHIFFDRFELQRVYIRLNLGFSRSAYCHAFFVKVGFKRVRRSDDDSEFLDVDCLRKENRLRFKVYAEEVLKSEIVVDIINKFYRLRLYFIGCALEKKL